MSTGHKSFASSVGTEVECSVGTEVECLLHHPVRGLSAAPTTGFRKEKSRISFLKNLTLEIYLADKKTV